MPDSKFKKILIADTNHTPPEGLENHIRLIVKIRQSFAAEFR